MIRDRFCSWKAWILLIFLTLGVYLQTVGFDFVNIDDDIYVTKNLNIKLFGTLEGFKWAFTYIGTANWHPLVWLSLMLDYKIFGMSAWGFHLHNVLLHLTSVLMLYGFLVYLTKAKWASFLVAICFAVHPMRVESVAWITQRKDTLSGFFCMLTFWGYALYAKTLLREKLNILSYICCLLFFTLGLLSKATLVFIPVLLFLMDYWPLERMPKKLWARDAKLYWVEKIPFLFLSFIFCIVTIYVSKKIGANFLEEEFNFLTRLGHSFVFYCSYLKLSFSPYDLSIYYPYPREGITIWTIGASVGLLIFITWGVWQLRKLSRAPLIGWLWFLAALLPMIGIIKAGAMPYSDRYTYIPHIGLFLGLIFGVRDIVYIKIKHKKVKRCLSIVAVLLVIIMGVLSWRQTRLWENSRTLYGKILDRYDNVYPIAINMGLELKESGEYKEALKYFIKAHEQYPKNDEPLFLIGWTYYLMGDIELAEKYLAKTVNLNFTHVKGQKLLAQLYEEQGDINKAIRHYSFALKYQESTEDKKLDATIPYNLANLLIKKKQVSQAKEYYLQAIDINPSYTKAHYNLGNIYFYEKDFSQSKLHYQKALTLDPEHQKAKSMLEKVKAS